MKKKLDFLIVGAQKAGTSSLYGYLSDIPSLFVPQIKENPYFLTEEFFGKGERYLERSFEKAPPERLWGIAQAQLMYFPETVARVQSHNPEIRIIAVLRNPIDRAYSAYWFARARTTEPAATFEDALALEPARATGSFTERTELTYLSHGYYARQLEPFARAFGRERIHVVLSDELNADPAGVVAGVTRWLGAGEDYAVSPGARRNEAFRPGARWLMRLMMAQDLKRALRRALPDGVRGIIRTRLFRPLLRRNATPFKYPAMTPATRVRLVEHFRPHNASLEEMLGRTVEHWNH